MSRKGCIPVAGADSPSLAVSIFVRRVSLSGMFREEFPLGLPQPPKDEDPLAIASRRQTAPTTIIVPPCKSLSPSRHLGPDS